MTNNLFLETPIGGTAYEDWTIVNYVDLDPDSGIQDFRGGNYTYNGHNAIDFTLPHFEAMDEGVPIYASLAGTVTDVSDEYPDRCSTENPCNTPANFIEIDHDDGVITRYLHLRTDSATVSIGDSVEAGQQIGLVGSSGNSSDAHLHFEVIKDGEIIEVNIPDDEFSWQNPIAYADDVVGSLDHDISDRSPSFEELRERPDPVDLFIQQPGLTPYLWTHLHGIDAGDDLDFYFYQPDGTEYQHLHWTAPQIRYGWWNAGIELPEEPDLGVWEVEFQHNGSTMLVDTFTVVPELSETITVDTLVDENDGDYSVGDLSLREAIALANEREGADTITFDESLAGGTIALDNDLGRDFNLNDSVSILGLGQDNLTLDGGFIFNVETDVDLELDGLNLMGGKIDSSGNLTFSNSTISQAVGAGSADNSAIVSRANASIVDSTIKDNNGGANVGIVIESGTATIERSAITGNDSSSHAQSGVIIYPETTVDIINSTIANNRARSNAGIENAGGTVNITNSTIVNNRGGLGGGGVRSFLADGFVTITSSIVANNTGTDGTFPVGDLSGEGEFISGGNNLIGNGDDVLSFVDGVNGDLVGSDGDDPANPNTALLIDPQLGELQNNGGSTDTFALLEDSSAIDAGSNPNNLETDQRGEGFNRTVGNGTDIGAYEVQTVSSSDDIIGTDNDDFLLGTESSDRIFGLDGTDYIDGLASDDFLSGGNGNDYLLGRNGLDTIEGDAGNDLIEGGNDDDLLRGGDGHDRILGGNGADTIDDGAGNDVLFGDRGDDVFLASNPGYDLFTGGNGSDSYVYNFNSDASFDRDRILDFSQADKIVFPSLNEFADLDTNDSGVLDSGDDRVHIFGVSTTIDFSDLFGRSPNSDTITLVGVNNLDASNFIFGEIV